MTGTIDEPTDFSITERAKGYAEKAVNLDTPKNGLWEYEQAYIQGAQDEKNTMPSAVDLSHIGKAVIHLCKIWNARVAHRPGDKAMEEILENELKPAITEVVEIVAKAQEEAANRSILNRT